MTKPREKEVYRPAGGYILGSADPELRRLQNISVLYRDATRRWLERAGIGTGMTVVDAGCGPGDGALLAAGLVGPAGTVIGVDSSPEALAMARSRAGAAGLGTVRFEVADIASWVPDRPVDAIVGRLILMHLPDPAATLVRLAGAVRPGGVVAFQDTPTSACPAWRSCRPAATTTSASTPGRARAPPAARPHGFAPRRLLSRRAHPQG